MNSMRLRQALVAGLVVLAALVVQAYLYMQGWFSHDKGVAMVQCTDDAVSENPNNILFVSCGGFLE